jgi:hypothetical protein
MWADRRALSYVQRSSTFPKPPLRISTSSHAASPFESFATTEKRAGGPGPLAACRPVGSADLGGEAKLVNRGAAEKQQSTFHCRPGLDVASLHAGAAIRQISFQLLVRRATSNIS